MKIYLLFLCYVHPKLSRDSYFEQLTMFLVLPLSFCFLILVFQGDAALITSRPIATPTIEARIGPKIDAIVPTTAGQIGINPVESDLGDPDTYLGTIYGTDTLYITMDAATTKVGLNIDLRLFILTLN